MNDGFISIVGDYQFESILQCLGEGKFVPESPAGECKLLDEVGEEVVVTEAEFRNRFSMSPAPGDSLGLLWKDCQTITWHRDRSASGLQILTLHTGWSSSQDFENVLRIVLHCEAIMQNPNSKMILADRRGIAELPEWLQWIEGGFFPSCPPELIAVQKGPRGIPMGTFPGFGFAKVRDFEVFWNPVFFEKSPTFLS